jgi:tRNA (guanine-N7-)-methyltransferase
MRQRKAKNLEEKLLEHETHMVTEPSLYRDRWTEVFSKERPLFLEIGCGKGRFLTTLAQKHPEFNFIGVEGHQTVALRALEKSKGLELLNVAIVPLYVKDVRDWFGKGSLQGIYLNFSDPWPKDRHEKRRLTSQGFLRGYGQTLGEEGFLQMKTDNDDLFQYSLESLERNGFEILEKTWDLHSSHLSSRNVMTEYEEKFAHQGLKIHYVKAKVSVLKEEIW